MRTRRDDLLHLVLVQLRDVLFRQHLKQKLIADAARGIARTLFIASENGKLNSSLVQELRGRPRHSLISFNQRATTADPQQHLSILDVADMFHVETISPIDACRIGAAERMAAFFQRHDCLLHRVRKRRFFHHQITPHVDNLRHLFDKHRTRFHARHTRGALPESCG